MMRVQKARIDRGEWKVLRKIVDRIQPLLSTSINRQLSRFKGKINLHDLTELIQQRRFREIEGIIPFSGALDVNSLDRLYSGALLNSAQSTQEFMRQAIGRIIPTIGQPSGFNVNTANPRVQRFILNQTASLVQGVTRESRRAIASAITSTIDFGTPPRRAALMIRDAIGLTTQQQTAVENFRAKLENVVPGKLTGFQRESLIRSTRSSRVIDREFIANLSQERIDRLTEDYAKRQLTYRSRVIAQNELQEAVNAGQRETWEQAKEQGVVNAAETRKQWIVTPDDRLCEICEPMDAVEVGLDEQFYVPGTDEYIDGPPSHINCRCALTMIFAEERQL